MIITVDLDTDDEYELSIACKVLETYGRIISLDTSSWKGFHIVAEIDYSYYSQLSPREIYDMLPRWLREAVRYRWISCKYKDPADIIRYLAGDDPNRIYGDSIKVLGLPQQVLFTYHEWVLPAPRDLDKMWR